MHTILLVEDDKDISDLLHELLEDEGFKVVLARNGKEALDFFENGNTANLILLDYMMPLLDGRGFLLEMEKSKPELKKQIPVLLMTAAGDVLINGMPQVSCIVKKPIDLETFLKNIKTYIH